MMALLQADCTRPFFEYLAEAVSNPDALFDWVFCPYVITGLGWTGVGLIILATGFIGIKNWSESWTLPLTWLALVGPVLATAMLPGDVVRRVAGVITVAFAMLIIGLWWWWGRS